MATQPNVMAWFNSLRSVVGKKAAAAEPAPPARPAAPVPVPDPAENDLKALKAEKDAGKRIAACNAFLSKHGANKNLCAEVGEMLAAARAATAESDLNAVKAEPNPARQIAMGENFLKNHSATKDQWAQVGEIVKTARAALAAPDLKAIKAEKDPAKQVALCETFLKNHGTVKDLCAEAVEVQKAAHYQLALASNPAGGDRDKLIANSMSKRAAENDLKALQAETDPAKRIALCNAFLGNHKAHAALCAEVGKILAADRAVTRAAAENDLKALQAEDDDAKQIKLGEEFLKNHSAIKDLCANVSEILNGAHYQLALKEHPEGGDPDELIKESKLKRSAPSDLKALKEEMDVSKRIELCEAFLYKYKDFGELCADVDKVKASSLQSLNAEKAGKVRFEMRAAAENDLKALQAETDPTKRIGLCEAFLKKHSRMGDLCGDVGEIMKAAHLKSQLLKHPERANMSPDELIAASMKERALEKAQAAKRDLDALKNEKDPNKRIYLGEAFLKTHGDVKNLCAEVDKILEDAHVNAYLLKHPEKKGAPRDELIAESMKERGVEKAKDAYLVQAKGEEHPEYNPKNPSGVGNVHDLKHFQATKAKDDLTDTTGSGLNEPEVHGVKTYTGKDYQYINPAVANQKDKGVRDPETGKVKDWMDSQAKTADEKREKYEEGALHAGMINEAFKKMPGVGSNTPLYRGARLTKEKFESDWKQGKEITYEAFTSTSTDMAEALKFANGQTGNVQKDEVYSVLVELNVADAKYIEDLSLYKGQKEALVRPGTVLVVQSVKDDLDRQGKNPYHDKGTVDAIAWKKVVLVPKKNSN